MDSVMNLQTGVSLPTAARATADRSALPMPSKMSVEHLDFHYGKFHALRDVSLEIAENHVTAFIGPSGCGKSTLLRTLNRMYSLYPGQRATGQVLLDDENILSPEADATQPRYRVGM